MYQEIAYDASGNITWDGVNAYEYYCDNRLGFVATGSGFFSYSYDLLGRRIRRLDLLYSEFVEYVWDGEHIIAEYDSEGSLIRKYIYGPGTCPPLVGRIDNPVVMINADGGNETRYYYYTDALGSVRLMSNSNGQIVEGYSYDPFGRPTVNTTAGTDSNWLTPDGSTSNASAIGNPYMFTGRQWDSATGIYYYRFRDYHPTLGRFLQPDPAGYIDSLNLYTYCTNNPINWFDPLGLEKTHQAQFKKMLGKEELTMEDLQRAMRLFYETTLQGRERLSFYEWKQADTCFHSDTFRTTRDYYRFDGQTYHKSEINYIGLGMAAGHIGLGENVAGLIPYLANWVPYRHGPTTAELLFFYIGYYSYPTVADQ